MERRDHHDWASETYVDEWVRRQQAEDPSRAERFALMCDLFPFPRDAAARILDIGAGYGPVSRFVLDRYPSATCIGQDGSEPMLRRARSLLASYGDRFRTHRSDLFATDWLPVELGSFDAVVSSICLHNLRSFERISEIYREVRARVKAGGVFLNVDLVNAPSPELEQRYVAAAVARRQREEGSRAGVESMAPRAEGAPASRASGPFPADLAQQLAALRAAGFKDVDCFWKDLRRALFGGFT
jgi:tRNA (cmo5U34)-methyltransferase